VKIRSWHHQGRVSHPPLGLIVMELVGRDMAPTDIAEMGYEDWIHTRPGLWIKWAGLGLDNEGQNLLCTLIQVEHHPKSA
jgi:hypothetical protein